jgi:phospholipase C
MPERRSNSLIPTAAGKCHGLKTVERRWDLPAQRDAAAPDFVVTLAAPRNGDPLAGAVVPVANDRNPAEDRPSHLQEVHAELVSQLPVPDGSRGAHHAMLALHTGGDYMGYIRAGGGVESL